MVGHGEGVLSAWYASKVAVAAVSSPFYKAVPADVFANAPRRKFIDELVLDKLRSSEHSSVAAGGGRRVLAPHVHRHHRHPAHGGRNPLVSGRHRCGQARQVDRGILARPEFVDYWAYKWSDLLLVNSEKLKTPAMWAYYSWIRNQVEADTPWDEFARQIVTATGGTLENGATNFYVLHQDPLDLAETTSVAFLGMSINVPRCHNHPLEKWTNGRTSRSPTCSPACGTKRMRRAKGNLIVYAGREGRSDSAADGQATAACSARMVQAKRSRLARRSPDGAGQWLHVAGESIFQPIDHQSRVGEFLWRGAGRKGRRMRLTNPASNERCWPPRPSTWCEQATT